MAAEVVRYDESHGEELLTNLREIDRRELYMLSRLEPMAALSLTLALSVASWTGFMDGKIVCVFGISRKAPLSEIGVPWLVGTDLIAENYRPFARISREYYARFAKAFPQMENFVLADNAVTVRWLKWLGFDMGEPAPLGFSRAPFIRFSKGM